MQRVTEVHLMRRFVQRQGQSLADQTPHPAGHPCKNRCIRTFPDQDSQGRPGGGRQAGQTLPVIG